MPTSLIRWLSQGYKTFKENAWLLSLISAIGLFGISLLRSEMHRQVSPLADMIRWDFESRGVWGDYLRHKAQVDSQEKAFQPQPSASAGYPIFHFGEP